MPVRKLSWFLALTALWVAGCSKEIYLDRSQLIKDGEAAPTIDLNVYRSVQERPHQDSSLALAMAISGGGSRAANFAIGIMLGLEKLALETRRDVLDEIDYFSTVSGGGFAGGAYLAALYEHDYFQVRRPFNLWDYLDLQIREDLSYNYTSVLLRARFNPKLWFSYIDDGDALETAIDDLVLGRTRRGPAGTKKSVKSILLGDIFIPKDSLGKPVRYPMLVANSSVLSTWAIFPFTPDILEYYRITGYDHQMKHHIQTIPDPFKVPLAVGIKASGSFPALIANSTLLSTYHEDRPYLHLIDGAMTDNLGYYTALEILKAETTPRKALFIIDADGSGLRYTFSPSKKAENGFAVFNRLPESGLDARKRIFERDVNYLDELWGVQPVVFSFNVLIKDNETQIKEAIHWKEEQQRLCRLMSADMDALTEGDLQILYELVTHISTKYSIEEEEQELLLLTGQKIVLMLKEEIYEALR